MSEKPVEYRKQINMLTALSDAKKQVERGEVTGLVLVLARADGKKELWTSALSLADVSACSCMLQAHVIESWNQPDEVEG